MCHVYVRNCFILSRVYSIAFKYKFKYKFNKLFPIMEKLIDEINANHTVITNKLEKLNDKIKCLSNNSGDSQSDVHSQMDIDAEKRRLINENDNLKMQITQLIDKLNTLEAKNKGSNNIDISNLMFGTEVYQKAIAEMSENKNDNKIQEIVKDVTEKDIKRNEKKTEKPKKESKASVPNDDGNKPLDASRLDLRVGKIINVKKHPDADQLYVEEIDCGDESPRTVVSGLVRFIPIEDMQNRMVVVLCNLKPAKMRGITSEAMVMCASTPENVEILIPPDNAVPGDRISFEEYPGDADAQLNPKKKIWEQIAPDLKTNGECVATYKGAMFRVKGKGIVKAPSLANVQVK